MLLEHRLTQITVLKNTEHCIQTSIAFVRSKNEWTNCIRKKSNCKMETLHCLLRLKHLLYHIALFRFITPVLYCSMSRREKSYIIYCSQERLTLRRSVCTIVIFTSNYSVLSRTKKRKN